MPERVPQTPPHDNNLDLAIGNSAHNGHVELPPAILRDLLSDAVRYVVRDEDDATHLRSQGFYELWVPEPDQLDLETVKPHNRLAVIQRSSEEGTRYGCAHQTAASDPRLGRGPDSCAVGASLL